MIKVEITPSQAKLQTRSGTTKDGRAYSINEQKAYIYLGGDYPTEFTISLENGQPPYLTGLYHLHESSLFVGQYSRLNVGKVILVSAQDKK